LNQRLFYSSLNKKFSGGHGHGDGSHGGHEHHEEPTDYHNRKFNRVSYNQVLGKAEREK